MAGVVHRDPGEARLARNQLLSDPQALDGALADLGEEAQSVLAGLRALAQGIHPSVLTDRGLRAALEAQADRAPIPIVIKATGPAGLDDQRFADEIEGAAYFVASEALANAFKHSHSATARVGLSVRGGTLCVEVADDGTGFDPDRTAGNGLAHLSDRAIAVGGALSVVSAPGAGTVVTATFPARPRRLPGPEPETTVDARG